jgi:hypothetical protein
LERAGQLRIAFSWAMTAAKSAGKKIAIPAGSTPTASRGGRD